MLSTGLSDRQEIPDIPVVHKVPVGSSCFLTEFLCYRTAEGDMFVVKDPDLFATQIIPQYFDHNKFSSFARQLNFYGFRKMQAKPIRNSDFDAGSAKHVTFYNENFKRGRCDLLKKIQRSTRGGAATPGQDVQKDMQALREHVFNLEQQIIEMNTQFEDRLRGLELDMLARMEQMMLTFQQQQQTQLQLQKATSVGSSPAPMVLNNSWVQNSMQFNRGNSVASSVNSVGVASSVTSGVMNGASGMHAVSSSCHSVSSTPSFQQQQTQTAPLKPQPMPTLPPHPKQKQLPLPTNGLPGAMGAPPERFNSLRGISALTRGLSRGASIESSASAVLLRNSWEDKFFSMLMLDANDQNGSNNMTMNSMIYPTPIQERGSSSAQPAVSNRSAEDNADLSSVSSSDIP